MKLWIVLLALCLGTASAAEPQRNLGIVSVTGEKRVALVIGNGAYPGAPLKNPVNDAKDMALALRKLGFDVIEKTDATQKEMNRAIARFGEKLRADTVALFYYAGHGMQVKGKNYLLPIDAQIASEASARAETVDVDTVMDQLAITPMNIVILDACRNNPFERRFRSAAGGLAQMDAPKGSLIAYATAPGKVAADGDGKNGLYTQELLKHIQTPGLALEAVFKRVRNGVIQASGDMQTPWEASSLTGDFYFRTPGGEAVEKTVAMPAGEPTPFADISASNSLAIELAFWQTAKESNDPAQLQAYLVRYPNGEFAPLARLRLESGKSLSGAPSTAQPTQPLIDLLPTAAFDASSTWGQDIAGHGPANARYSVTDTHSNWSAATNDSNQWLRVDLQRTTIISAIGTKGRFHTWCVLLFCQPQWVTAYHLAYSLDGASWQYVEENGSPTLFMGNNDNLTEVRHDLASPIRARFLRFHPKSWNGYITMRVEAYGFAATP